MGKDETWLPEGSNPSATWSETGRDADLSDPSSTWSTNQGAPVRESASVEKVVAETVDRYADPISLGKGAMGDVTAVWDTHLERLVARKTLRHDIPPHKQSLARERFLREARVTARLEHPAIVPVYELGRSVSGHFYYTMLKVQGESLSQALKACGSIKERLTLLPRLATAAHAVGYAHDRKVVHRDLKPANVMLGEFGETLVIDWGLARELDTDSTIEEAALPEAGVSGDGFSTQAGSVLGTPRYMSPEQARGEPVYPPSDVWGLGMMLLELLAGERWHPELDARGLVEALRAGAHPDVSEMAGNAPAELVAIAERALSLHPAERYANAEAFAEELDASIVGDRVQAYSYSGYDLVARFVARNRLAVGVTALAGVVVIGLAAFAAQRVLLERDRAVDAEHRALDALDEALAGRLVANARSQELAGEYPRALANLRAAESLLGETPELEVEIERMVRASGWLQVVGETQEMWYGIAERSPGVLVGGLLDGSVLQVDLETDTTVRLGHAPGVVRAVAPVGDRVAFSGEDGVVRWVGDDGAMRELTGEPLSAYVHRLTTHGDRLVAVSAAGDLAMFDAQTGDELWRRLFPAAFWVSFSPDGTRLLSVSAQGIWRVVDVETGQVSRTDRVDQPLLGGEWVDNETFVVAGTDLLHIGPQGLLGQVLGPGERATALDVDESWWVMGDVAGRIVIVDREHGRTQVVDAHDARISKVVLAPPVVITASHDGTVQVRDLSSGTRIQTLGGHVGGVIDAIPLSDGRLAVSAEDEVLSLWTRVEPALRHRFATDAGASVARFDPLGDVVVTGDEAGTLRLYDAATGRLEWTEPVHRRDVRALDFVPGGVISSAWDGQLVYTDLKGEEQARVGVDASGGLVREGDWVWAVSESEGVARWNWRTGELWEEPAARHTPYDVDARAGWLATGGWDGRVGLWDEELDVTWLTAAGRIWDLEMSPDGSQLAAATSAGLVQVWRVNDPILVAEVHLGDEPAYVATWTPDGRLVTADARGRVRVDAPPWDEHVKLEGLEDSVLGVWASNDHVVAAAADGRWYRWDAETGQPLNTGVAGNMTSLDVSADGRKLLLQGADVELWQIDGLAPITWSSNLRVCEGTNAVVRTPLDWDEPFAPAGCDE